MQSQGRTLSVSRIALISGVLLVLGILSLIGSIQAVVPAPIDESGAMSDRVLEAENDGVPAAVVRRRMQVREAIESSPQSAWAGEYYQGDGLGENVALSLARNAGIAAIWQGCTGLYGSNEGDVEERDDGALLFHFSGPNGEAGEPILGTFPTIVRPVRWGMRRYLLTDEQMMAFVNAMHRGWEPRTEPQGFFLLARDDDKVPVSGLPALPQSVLASVRSSPLIVHVSSVESAERVGRADFPECRVRIRIRIPDGESVARGLEFEVTDPPSEYASFRVMDVADREVLAEDTLFQDCLDTAHLPTTAWVLSSGAYAAK